MVNSCGMRGSATAKTRHVILDFDISLIPGAKDVINMLQKEGNELIVISARGGMIEEMKDRKQYK